MIMARRDLRGRSFLVGKLLLGSLMTSFAKARLNIVDIELTKFLESWLTPHSF